MEPEIPRARVICECGAALYEANMAKHRDTATHKKNVEREKRKAKHPTEYIPCECGAIIHKYHIRRHRLSVLHIQKQEER